MKNWGLVWLVILIVVLAGGGFWVFGRDAKLSISPEATSTTPTFNGLITWHEATSTIPWPKRDAPTSWEVNGKLYLAGGIDGETNTTGEYVEYWKLPHFNDIWSTTDGEHWSLEREHTAWAPRRSLSIIPFKNQYFLYGGWSPNDGYKTGIWVSDNGLDWIKSTTTPPWEGREGQVVVNHLGRLYFVGGVNFDKRKEYNDVWVSDNGIDWQEVASSTEWALRYDQAVESWGGYLWLSGGVNLGGESGYADVWRSVDGKTWELITNNAPWGERHGHIMFGWRDHLWIFSGWDIKGDKGWSDVWYSADGKNWQQSGGQTPWEGREDLEVNVLGDKLIMFTGMKTGFKWTNDVWIGELAK